LKVGYIGLGAMGSALARRLVHVHPTLVWDLNPKAVAALVQIGAEAAPTTKDLAAECEIVFLCLPRSSDVEHVIFGSGGLAEGLKPGTLIVDQTSGIPSASCAFASRLATLGIGMIDAPVAGGVPAAIAGTVAIMVSGADRDLSRAMPLLQAISPRVYRCSDRVGDAQAAKLVNNCVNSGYRMATLELVALGRMLGLSLPVMTRVLDKGWGSNFTAKRLLPSLIAKRPSTDFALSLMLKDVNQCLAIGMASGAPMPISVLARGLMQAGLNLLSPRAGLDEVVGAIERLTAVSILDAAPEDADFAPGGTPPERSRVGLCGTDRLSAGTLAALQAHPAIDVLTDDLSSAELPGLIIDFTRRCPAEFQRLASQLAVRGVSLIDIGSVAAPTDPIDMPGAWLCGGSEAAFAMARPVIEATSGAAIHCGPTGSARLAELIAGAVALCNRAIVYENAQAGLKFGLEPSAMATALNEGSGWSAEGALVLEALVTGGSTTCVTLGAMLDELNELMRLAMVNGAPLFIAGTVRIH
jgi:3-hydroxyisobutyrate dehydrogenase